MSSMLRKSYSSFTGRGRVWQSLLLKYSRMHFRIVDWLRSLDESSSRALSKYSQALIYLFKPVSNKSRLKSRSTQVNQGKYWAISSWTEAWLSLVFLPILKSSNTLAIIPSFSTAFSSIAPIVLYSRLEDRKQVIANSTRSEFSSLLNESRGKLANFHLTESFTVNQDSFKIVVYRHCLSPYPQTLGTGVGGGPERKSEHFPSESVQ